MSGLVPPTVTLHVVVRKNGKETHSFPVDAAVDLLARLLLEHGGDVEKAKAALEEALRALTRLA